MVLWESRRSGRPLAPGPGGTATRFWTSHTAERRGATRSVGHPRASPVSRVSFQPRFPSAIMEVEEPGQQDKNNDTWRRRASSRIPTSRPLPSCYSSCSFLAVPCQTHQQLDTSSHPIISPPRSELSTARIRRGSPVQPPQVGPHDASSWISFLFASWSIHTSPHARNEGITRFQTLSSCPFVAPAAPIHALITSCSSSS